MVQHGLMIARDRPLEPTGTHLRTMMGEVTEYLVGLVDGIRDAPVSDFDGVPELLADPELRRPPGDTGRPLAELLSIVDRAAAKGLDAGHPGHLAYIPGSGLVSAAIADLRAADLHRYLPYAASFPLPGVSGSAVLSRHPLTATAHRPLRGGAVQAQATLDVPGARPVEVESAHPAAPWGRPGMANWYRDLRAQPPATVDGHLRILLGDFNATLDHVALRRLVNSGYRDAAEVSGTGLRTSWPSQGQRLMAPVTLDHVLADRRIGVAEARPYLIAGTDHRAVYAELVIPRP
ncbi:hypothetical protein GCM10009558_100440 [Virgisporangium aurantiacum]